MPLTAIIALVLFTALMLFASLHGLSASGHFPRGSRLPDMATGAGRAVLWGSIVVTALCFFVALAAAWLLIPWYASVIGGGGAVLVAPLVLRWFPDRFVDGKAALVAFAATATVLAVMLLGLIVK
jgi:hypothetical protein